ncbi:MAG: helix-turn-helix transcriptional regulator [Vicinamibacterales bacterium]
MDAIDDRLLTIDEVAAILRKPRGTLYHWRQTGRGPRGFRNGRTLAFRKSDVDAWIAAQVEADGDNAA